MTGSLKKFVFLATHGREKIEIGGVDRDMARGARAVTTTKRLKLVKTGIAYSFHDGNPTSGSIVASDPARFKTLTVGMACLFLSCVK